MTDEARRLRFKLNEAQIEAAMANNAVEALENRCSHQWTEPKYDPIYHKGYTVLRDEPDIDYRFEHYVEPRNEHRWTKDCKICGKHVETKYADVKTIEQKTPRF